MKKILLLAFMAIGLMTSAQNASNPEKPVQWSANIENFEGEPHLYIRAKVEKGWHFFSANPGGDGLAIPTEIRVTWSNGDGELEVPVLDAQANLPPVEHEIEGMGKLKYFEGDVVYSFPIAALNTRNFTIDINYQCCNDKMCLPPAIEQLEVRGQ
jgi:thiol:disulfide interchange protein DsbD